MTELSGKVAFVTGGASGIGLAIARALAKRGCRIMLADINTANLAKASADFQSGGFDVGTVLCDVSSIDAVKSAAQATLERFGKVHIIVNNAGVAVGGMAGTIAIEDWRWIVDINLMGVAHGIEVFLPLIRSHKEGGHIVNTASMAGHVASPAMSPYHATKFAVVGYSEALQTELESENIGVSVLCPAWVRTDIHKSAFAKPTGGGSVDDPQFKAMSAVIDSGLDADIVGEWTAQCIADDRFYIFTHPDYKDFVDKRHARITNDYNACAANPAFQKT
jgi:NAD(P)-dependent dehydrogenase (short-subunit alcohol dehydrogenase family)